MFLELPRFRGPLSSVVLHNPAGVEERDFLSFKYAPRCPPLECFGERVGMKGKQEIQTFNSSC